MDPRYKEEFASIIKNDAIIKVLEYCDITSYEDLICLNESLLVRIEHFINLCLENKNLKSHDISAEFIYNSQFKFPPIYFIRILRAAKALKNNPKSNNLHINRISGYMSEDKPTNGDVNNNNHSCIIKEVKIEKSSRKRFNNSFLTDIDNVEYPIIDEDEDKIPAKVSRSITPTELDTTRKSSEENLSFSLNLESLNASTDKNHSFNSLGELLEANKTKELNRIAARIHHHAKTYFNVTLVHKKDFDVDIELSQDTDNGCTKKSGIFLCYLCKTVKGGNSRIRFNITPRNYYVLSNVTTHLSKHFQRNRRAYDSL